MRRHSPDMTPQNTGEGFLGKAPKSFPGNPQDILDLHGYSVYETSVLVENFLKNAYAKSFLFVRIITGHGKSTTVGYSVLYSEVKDILKRKLAENSDIDCTAHNGYFDIKLSYWK